MKIIAESAFNHNGSLEYLLKLATAAKASEADIFTVQVMNVDAFCVENYERHAIYKDTEFSNEEWIQVFDYCKSIYLVVIPCVLDEVSFELCYRYGFRFIKIHATDITNKTFLKLIASKGDCKILLETQCATLFEINYAIKILGQKNIEALFTGYSNYPTEVEELNLNSLDYIKSEFNCDIGFADHSTDMVEVPLLVLAKNCAYLEKHITLSRNDRNFDWQVYLYPEQFTAMVNTLKYYQIALGNGVKHPMKNEKTFMNVLYKKKIEQSDTLKRADGGEYQI
jgi:sialic acid synthase SpsE